jgi:hypothetical protein
MSWRSMARSTSMVAFAGLLILFIADGTGNGTEPTSGNFGNTSSSSPSATSYALVVVGLAFLLLAIVLVFESIVVLLKRRRAAKGRVS